LATSTLLGPTTTATLVVVPTSTIIRQVVLRHLEWLGLLQMPKTQLLYQHLDPSTLPQPFVEAIVVEVEVAPLELHRIRPLGPRILVSEQRLLLPVLQWHRLEAVWQRQKGAVVAAILFQSRRFWIGEVPLNSQTAQIGIGTFVNAIDWLPSEPLLKWVLVAFTQSLLCRFLPLLAEKHIMNPCYHHMPREHPPCHPCPSNPLVRRSVWDPIAVLPQNSSPP